MNRELTKREKTLLLVLVVLVLVLGYCKLFLEPIDRQITSLRTNTDIEQAELDTDRVRLAQLEQMQQASAAIKASGLVVVVLGQGTLLAGGLDGGNGPVRQRPGPDDRAGQAHGRHPAI